VVDLDKLNPARDPWLPQRQRVEACPKQHDLTDATLKRDAHTIFGKAMSAGKVSAHPLKVRKIGPQ
jgi:hypothetical protein